MRLETVKFVGIFFIALSLGVASIAVSGDLDKGLAAAKSGDYTTALKELRPLAEQGLVNAQFILGSMYGDGQGAEPVNLFRTATPELM